MLKVFLVEDETVIREGLRDRIPWEQYGYRFVGEAADGLVALPLIRKTRPDVLITDIKMPFMDGLSLSRIVREEFPKTKILIISGYDDFEYARIALKYGAIDYLLKPINRNEFNQALERIYKNKQKLQFQGVERKKNELEQIKDEIDTNYMKDISLTNLSEAHFMNKDVLSRLFKKKYGVNITSYINDVRLTQAKIYLVAGYNSAQVSEMVGYHDSNYFSRVFKKYYGISPTQFVDEMNHS